MSRLLWLVLLFSATVAECAVLEVRRTSIIRAGPDRSFSKLARVEASKSSPVSVSLVGIERENGFYRVFVPNSDEIGWIPKGSGRLRGVDAHDTIAHFERNSFKHWTDIDGDCQDARSEVLIRDADGLVTFKSSRECVVESGLWIDPFTGREFTDPSNLDIDHVVPLENAFLSGAWNWTVERRELYANSMDDSRHLMAVDHKENRRKGSKGPEDYMPPNKSFHCDYIDAWISIKRDWGLKMTVSEAESAFGTHFGCVGLPDVQ